MRNYSVFFVVIILFVGTLLGWVTYSRIMDFERSHLAIAEETTSSVNEAITRFISERRRFVSVFTATHHKIIEAIISDPDNQDNHDLLVEKLRLFFPDYFAYSLVNQSGDPLFEDFDGLVGAQCLQDLKKFTQSKMHLPRVHPNAETYHFDIMVPVETFGKHYTFFVSFNADLLATILKNASIPDHELILALPLNNRKLIEVTTEGSRIHLDRDDFRMTQDEEQRILVAKDIEGTSWQILDLRKPRLFKSFETKVFITGLITLLVFIVITYLWYRYVRLSEKIRQDADRHKSEFLSTMSHELRTPLTAIKGSIGLIAANIGNDLSSQTLNLSKVALNNTDRLLGIVNDLLDIQKIESGKLSLELKTENLSNLVIVSFDAMRDYGKQFNVNYELTDLLPDTEVCVDRERFVQVISNLLSNATKYGKQNDVIEVSIIPYNNKVRLSVTDNGSGIPEEFQKNIFEKFSQAESHKGAAKNVKSTGLGLHIVKQLITLMGATINFSTSDRGTTFFIDLDIINQ